MKRFDNFLLGKEKGKSRKHKQIFKLSAKNCCPKIMSSHGYIIHEENIDPSGTSDIACLDESTKTLQVKEENVGCDVEHLCCDESDTIFEEDRSVCLISSSSEVEETSKVCEIPAEAEKNRISIDDQIEENDFDCSRRASAEISSKGDPGRPIFVDLTADEKKPWKQTIIKPCYNNTRSKTEESAAGTLPDHRIMIADSSSKITCNGHSSLATALRDRGPCMIPVQPNRCLPIRPVPSVPTRSFRKDCTPYLILPTSPNVKVVGEELVTSVEKFSREVPKGEKIKSVDELTSRNTVTSMDYVVPQISSVESLTYMTKKNSDIGFEIDDVKENRKKKRFKEADSNEIKGERMETSMKEFLTNVCASNATAKIQNQGTDKCARIISTSREESCKMIVPPLRLRKIVRAEDQRYGKSQIAAGIEQESNYRIVTDMALEPSGSPSSASCKIRLYNKDAGLLSINTDRHKLRYRRNRLKQKLQELRSKALQLAEQMANDTKSQQSTRLRQVMNRYEKQIENLSKLHSKLSAAASVSKKVADINNKSINNSNEEYLIVNLNERNARSSAEPLKLSPRSPTNNESMLQQNTRNCLPMLSSVCISISSRQNSPDEEVQVKETKVWPVNEEQLKITNPAGSLHSNCINNAFSSSDKNSGNRVLAQDNINVDTGHSDTYVNKKLVDLSKNSITLAEINCETLENKDETKGSSRLGFSDHAIPDSAVCSLEKPVTVLKGEMFEFTFNKETTSFPRNNEGSNKTQKVTCNPGQYIQLGSVSSVLNDENVTSQQDILSDSTQKSAISHPLTEQFPTLRHWLTRMSNKQASKSKYKSRNAGNVPLTSAKSTIHANMPGQNVSGSVDANTTGDLMSPTSQKQLLQQYAASITVSQPLPAVSSLRPGICPPIPVTQFCPNNYTIDPYNSAALNYHPTIYPYGTFAYPSRLHSTSMSRCHFPIQDGLRAMQPVNKRFPLMQDPMIRYPISSTSALHHPTNLEFDRLGENAVTNNASSSTCLSSIFLPSSTLSPSHQAFPRAPLIGYSTSNQYSRNRMVPDVVAAAAAAAVAAATSFDRQCDTITYNRADTDPLSGAGIKNMMNGQSSHAADSNKSAIAHQDVNNQVQSSNFKEGDYENTKYHQMQNYLLDRFALVETPNNFTQGNSVMGNGATAPVPSILSTAQFRIPLSSSHPQLLKNVPGNDSRNCETPHLGKMNRSPNSLHNFTCSNCGTIGPKFKCLGCEMAFYCNERCQEEHWCVHVQKCPKKMPKLKKVT